MHGVVFRLGLNKNDRKLLHIGAKHGAHFKFWVTEMINYCITSCQHWDIRQSNFGLGGKWLYHQNLILLLNKIHIVVIWSDLRNQYILTSGLFVIIRQTLSHLCIFTKSIRMDTKESRYEQTSLQWTAFYFWVNTRVIQEHLTLLCSLFIWLISLGHLSIFGSVSRPTIHDRK